jgi:hypothetical protein
MTTPHRILRLDARAARPRRSRWGHSVLVAASFGVALFAVVDVAAAPKAAEQLSHFAIDDADPSASVPDLAEATKDPVQFGYLLMDLAERADKATERKDYATAARYYKALIKAAPQRSVGYSKLCGAYTGLNDLANARESCYEALFHDGTHPIDYLRYLRLLLDSKPELGADDVKQADGVFAHLSEQKVEFPEVYQLECDVALRIKDVHRLENCTKALTAGWPDDPKTITYQWSLALQKKDFPTAEKLVQRARATSMGPAGVEQMESATLALKQKARPGFVLFGAAFLAVFLFGVLALRFFRNTRTTST